MPRKVAKTVASATAAISSVRHIEMRIVRIKKLFFRKVYASGMGRPEARGTLKVGN